MAVLLSRKTSTPSLLPFAFQPLSLAKELAGNAPDFLFILFYFFFHGFPLATGCDAWDAGVWGSQASQVGGRRGGSGAEGGGLARDPGDSRGMLCFGGGTGHKGRRQGDFLQPMKPLAAF